MLMTASLLLNEVCDFPAITASLNGPLKGDSISLMAKSPQYLTRTGRSGSLRAIRGHGGCTRGPGRLPFLSKPADRLHVNAMPPSTDRTVSQSAWHKGLKKNRKKYYCRVFVSELSVADDAIREQLGRPQLESTVPRLYT